VTLIRILTLWVIAFTVRSSLAGPIDFGQTALRQALERRSLNAHSIRSAIIGGTPECYSLSSDLVTGSDERGLMYGLLEASDQINATGKITPSQVCPATTLRGIRLFVHNQDLEQDWYYSPQYWNSYFEMLARNRFNRFNLVFGHNTAYMAPPYPYWFKLPQFSEIDVPGLTDTERDRNFGALRFISEAAKEHGIDFTLGIWEQTTPTFPFKIASIVQGITKENLGPYSRVALEKVLRECPAIHSVQLRTNIESGIPANDQVEYFRRYVFPAIQAAGRPVYTDVRGWNSVAGMIDAASQSKSLLRVSSKYWAEHLGRPYPPAETFPGYSYGDLLKKSRSYQFFWELWGIGSHRLLLGGDPDYVRRAVPTFSLGGGIGFEIDPPLAQKGFGNQPGQWKLFTDPYKDRIFWKWDFERYWFFYTLWGRLAYDPKTPDNYWMQEFQRRFGQAAPDVLSAYKHAGNIVHEIVASHLADPNMYAWPEANPGGVLESYRDTLPSDWRMIASTSEAVENRVRRVASAKQTPSETSARLLAFSNEIEKSIAHADAKLTGYQREWSGTRSDFQILSGLARYHALKQIAVEQVAYFDLTGDSSALDTSEQKLTEALKVWQQIVQLTAGLYPDEMMFGPDEALWKDRLTYVRHDLDLVRQRKEVFRHFGHFDFGFDFGGPVRMPVFKIPFTENIAEVQNSVAPRFQAVDPDTIYNDTRGYGWLQAGERTAHAIPLTPGPDMRSITKNPTRLRADVLYPDYIEGTGPQVFRIRAEPGRYIIYFLAPNHSERIVESATGGSFLDVSFPSGDWSVSGLVIRGLKSKPEVRRVTSGARPPRPDIRHRPPALARAGQDLPLHIDIAPHTKLREVRLYYRALNQNASFKVIEHTAGNLSFVIPAADISADFDLMYYFELLTQSSGWFHPDPQRETPYYVVPVQLR
jgi:hypothetical protein